MVITSQERDRFDRNGYLIFDPEVDAAALDCIVADLGDKYEGDARGGVYQPGVRIQDAWRFSEPVRSLAVAPKVLAILEEIYDCKPLPFQTLNFPVGTEQNPHSDTIHFNSLPSGYMCGIWVALEDMDMDNGPLIYYPGSHRLPELSVEQVDRAIPPQADQFSTGEFYARYERFIADRIARFDLKPEYSVIRKGQALLWAANLLHGGSARRDGSRTRHSQVTHYYFEGCQYYTPLMSRGTDIYWRKPEWIPTSATLRPAHEPAAGAGGKPDYEGFHDVADCSMITGWAWDKKQPGAPVRVDIYDGNALLATVTAEQFRPDVADYTKDNGFHGFSYNVPRGLRDGRSHSIRVRFSGTKVDLSNSPKEITCHSS